VPKFLQGKLSADFMIAGKSNVSEGMSQEQLQAEKECERLSMVNINGWDALDILCSSSRVVDDLARCM
jgi:hypothetical protein